MENILPGVSAMANVHPLFVHYPTALLSVFLLLEVLGALFKSEACTRAASWFLLFGTLGAIVAVAAGFRAAATVPHAHQVHDIMENHEHLGVAVLAMALLLSFWRLFARRSLLSGKVRLVYIIIAFVMFVTMTLGADFGGLMVYKYGVGVQAVKIEPGHLHGSQETAHAPAPAAPGEDLHSTGNVHDHGGADHSGADHGGAEHTHPAP
ncbi:MAG: DUF2231 domain-containing protein [Thermodesulfobacteriota bacterium]